MAAGSVGQWLRVSGSTWQADCQLTSPGFLSTRIMKPLDGVPLRTAGGIQTVALDIFSLSGTMKEI